MLDGIKVSMSRESVDEIIKASLLDSYYTNKDEIDNLTKKKKLSNFDETRLDESKEILEALIVMIKYYVVRADWPLEITDE